MALVYVQMEVNNGVKSDNIVRKKTDGKVI